jgi:hypothetical protein
MLAIEVSRWWDSLSSYVPHSVMHINQFMWSIIRRSWLTLLESLQLYPRRVSIIIIRISGHGGVTPHGRRTCYATMTGDKYSCDFLDQPILILTIFLSLRNQVFVVNHALLTQIRSCRRAHSCRRASSHHQTHCSRRNRSCLII